MRYRAAWLNLSLATFLLLASLAFTSAAAAAEKYVFPDRFMFRLAAYNIRDADTDMSVLSGDGVGTGFSYTDDLGGDDELTIPRIDGYFRFKKNHRIEFSHFRIERDGRRVLTIELDIGEEAYSVGDTIVSDINYELFKIGYAYSFYHSPSVEISLTAGLNVTTYEFDYQLVDGTSADSSDASGPLPMFGLRMSYALNPRWSVQYLSEVFFINIGDELEGSFHNFELSLEYRLHNNFVLGAGITRFSTDLDARDSEWNGRLVDSHSGVLIFASYYL